MPNKKHAEGKIDHDPLIFLRQGYRFPVNNDDYNAAWVQLSSPYYSGQKGLRLLLERVLPTESFFIASVFLRKPSIRKALLAMMGDKPTLSLTASIRLLFSMTLAWGHIKVTTYFSFLNALLHYLSVRWPLHKNTQSCQSMWRLESSLLLFLNASMTNKLSLSNTQSLIAAFAAQLPNINKVAPLTTPSLGKGHDCKKINSLSSSGWCLRTGYRTLAAHIDRINHEAFRYAFFILRDNGYRWERFVGPGLSPLGMAIWKNNAYAFSTLIASPHIDVNAPNGGGVSNLMLSAASDTLWMFKVLLQRGANPHAIDDIRGRHALAYAVAYGAGTILEYVLEKAIYTALQFTDKHGNSLPMIWLEGAAVSTTECPGYFEYSRRDSSLRHSKKQLNTAVHDTKIMHSNALLHASTCRFCCAYYLHAFSSLQDGEGNLAMERINHDNMSFALLFPSLEGLCLSGFTIKAQKDALRVFRAHFTGAVRYLWHHPRTTHLLTRVQAWLTTLLHQRGMSFIKGKYAFILNLFVHIYLRFPRQFKAKFKPHVWHQYIVASTYTALRRHGICTEKPMAQSSRLLRLSRDVRAHIFSYWPCLDSRMYLNIDLLLKRLYLLESNLRINKITEKKQLLPRLWINKKPHHPVFLYASPENGKHTDSKNTNSTCTMM